LKREALTGASAALACCCAASDLNLAGGTRATCPGGASADGAWAPRLSQVALMALSQHPNVVGLRGSYLHAGHVFVVMEAMEGGRARAPVGGPASCCRLRRLAAGSRAPALTVKRV